MTWSQNLSVLPKPLKYPLARTRRMLWEVGLRKELAAPRVGWSPALVGGGVGGDFERCVRGGAQPKLGVGTEDGVLDSL